MEHTIRLNDPWFDYIKTGQKKYEGRCFWKSVLNYKIGDTLKVMHHQNPEMEPFYVKIVNIVRFKTFEEALSTMNIEEILPGVQTVQEGVEIYYKFVSLQTQLIYGVCMIEMHKQ